MTGEWSRFGLTALCVLAGCFALLTAMVGLFRFDFTLNRLHAASIADTLGLSLLVLAVMLAVKLGREGMRSTDVEILKIMLEP